MKEFTKPSYSYSLQSLVFVVLKFILHDLRGIAEYNIEDILVYFRTLPVLMIAAPTVVKYSVVSRKALSQ